MLSNGRDEEIDHLLAEGRLAGPTKDRIFDAVIERVGAPAPSEDRGTEGRRPRSWRFWTGGLLVLAGAAAVWLLVPRSATHDLGTDFRPKGPASPGARPQLDAVCAGASLAACPVGATLVLGVSEGEGGFLAAYAEPERAAGSPGGERIWYFSKEGESPRLAPGDGAQAARKAIRIGAEHLPGDYQVHLFLTRSPLGRAQLLALEKKPDVIASRRLSMRVVRP